jgi:hypothetical protein
MQHSKLLHTCVLLLVGVACGPSSDDVISFSDHQTATHELTRRMTLSETEDLIFGRLTALLVASDGTVLVADQQLFTIHQFDADGAYSGRIGQEGRGPGEFEAIGNMSFGRNDSLYVWDWSATRLSVFARTESTWTFTRSFIMKRDNDGYFLSTLSRRPWLDGYLILESVPFFTGLDQPEIKHPRFREITENGEELRVITSYPPSQSVVTRTENSVTVYTLPFGRSAVVEFDHEGTVHKSEWNERLSISRFSLDGDSLGGFSKEVEVRNVDLAHLARITSGTDTEYYKTVVDEVPETYPAFVRFKVSEKGNYWVDMGELTEGVQLWLVFNSTGDILASYLLPGTTRIQTFQNGMMYTFESAEDGTQSVGVYESDF